MFAIAYRAFSRALVVPAVLLLAVPAAGPASAFFGLFGSDDEIPEPNNASIPYEITFEAGDNDDVEQALEDASTTYQLREDPPPDGEALARRVQNDLTRLIDAQWGAGYYNARVRVFVGEVPLELGASEASIAAAGRAAEGFRGRARVPVRVVAEPGQLFTFRDVRIVDADTGQPFRPEALPERIVNIEPGEPARAADILAAEARIIDHFRGEAHPFVASTDRDPVVYHDQAVMDVTVAVKRGPTAGIGDIALTGLQNVDPRVVRSFIYTERGTPYSPEELRDMRRSISRIEAISSVRIREAKELDAEGNLPLSVTLGERKPRLIGGAAKFSTVDGPAVNTYWAHRNLFGGAERLRLDAAVFFAQRGAEDGIPDFGEFAAEDIGGRLSASFLKPALGGTRNDFLLDVTGAREATRGYLATFANATGAIRHRFSDSFSIQGGLEFETGESEDALTDFTGEPLDYTLVGVPLQVTYDSTDNEFDPTEGFRITGRVTPYASFMGSSVDMTIAQASASTYWSIDEDNRYILAGRIGLGSIVGAELDEIPSNRRFFAGGGGSVRGYGYRTLGPSFPEADGDEQPIGGRSLLEASVEARLKITDTIGIVPFIDAGTAFDESYPDFGEDVKIGAGIGLRYYTGIGPIRVDVAVPVNPGENDPAFALYIGIGQAF